MSKKKGRPSAYKPEFIEQAKKLCQLGATDIELADFFGVTERTIYRWQIEHPEFCQALKLGKTAADDRIERSLFRRALGYSHEAVKILQNNGVPVVVPYTEHYPPDTTAAIFWLKNRRPGEWRDKREVEHSGSVDWVTELRAADERVERAAKH